MDEDLTFVDRLHRDLREVHWPEPAEIRARARRRSRRTAVLSAVTVLVVLAGSATAVSRGPTGSPTPTAPVGAPAPFASRSSVPVVVPARVEIPLAALLTPADLPVKTGPRLGTTGLAETVQVDPLLESCGREREVAAQLPVSRASRSQTLLRPGARVDVPIAKVLSQDVYRIELPRGRWLFGEIDRLLNACADWTLSASMLTADQQPARTEQEHSWEPAARDFAGDQSVLLRHVARQPREQVGGEAVGRLPVVETTLVVRVGDLVTVVAPAPDTVADRVDGTGPGLSQADLITLGGTAAKRLCPATEGPC
ncbi:hypothetical protein GA0070216_11019 [Micromonospora matsumotoense]|uniref:Uncharacterized protein n=1 Tax=Micromonospora matsumotoense TaxID=121616 RepID=A0A1C4ZKD5_9ACTN|nr:hypothetical protein [Micromonospora matsumotoense]SCF33241.1 hypothetical protein GA0070216_11019 [Micromonospora matsumotoense]